MNVAATPTRTTDISGSAHQRPVGPFVSFVGKAAGLVSGVLQAECADTDDGFLRGRTIQTVIGANGSQNGVTVSDPPN
jgi:hypothetical protein